MMILCKIEQHYLDIESLDSLPAVDITPRLTTPTPSPDMLGICPTRKALSLFLCVLE